MNNKTLFVALGAVTMAVLAGCGPQQPEANLQNLTVAMNAYLAKKGDLCLGKNKWPIDVPQREAGTRARNAVQMPVLERLGLVSSEKTKAKDDKDTEAGEIEVTRYALTGEGKKYFLEREPQADFCAAHLTLDKIVGWEAPKNAKEPSEAVVVTYTYRIDAAPWTGDAEVQKAFPMVDRVVRGAGTMQLKQNFRRTETGWIPAEI
ncbi:MULTISPECIES: hypothetical protein [unclassified Variovorax]|jgi:hypothetical protein|uniref:hypothetical protein n=1 Tax=unclassified Variovorax TaxID=663243 RepID=UPI000F7E65E5|nr:MULTISPECIES: hypothetical protein [unclassified Variovorax]RSZ36231.1 hypothetical protein EJO70_24415 [Variovorax sp. 553]RSZ36611.1 hypothetical protein EJO71_23050 [Variovorax sp. 679]